MSPRPHILAILLTFLWVACASRFELETEMNSLMERAAGNYTGANWLWFENPEVPEESATTIDVAGNEIRYAWEFRGQAQTGVMAFSFEGDGVSAHWTDTWHAKEPIVCPGTRTRDRIEVVGTYGPGWSWRTELSMPSADELLVEMFNISPEGEEQIAVRMRGARR